MIFFVGGPTGTRTLDPLLAKQMLYQLSYWPSLLRWQKYNILNFSVNNLLIFSFFEPFYPKVIHNLHASKNNDSNTGNKICETEKNLSV